MLSGPWRVAKRAELRHEADRSLRSRKFVGLVAQIDSLRNGGAGFVPRGATPRESEGEEHGARSLGARAARRAGGVRSAEQRRPRGSARGR